MRRLSAWLLLTALLSIAFSAFTPAIAQEGYGDDLLQRLVNAERASRTTVQVELSLNNLLGNVLNIGRAPAARTDRQGFNIVEIGATQAVLPVVFSLPPGSFSTLTYRLENTDLAWTVRGTAGGLFLTNFPLYQFPAGEYYLTANNVRLIRVVIPEGYAATAPRA